MERSLGELRIAMPMSRKALSLVMAEVVRRNRVVFGSVYLQISRGVARRDHPFPLVPTAPGVIVVAKHQDRKRFDLLAENGVGVITVRDIRWGRVDIKTVGLLPNVLAKQAAREAGAREAWLVDGDGFITEGGSSNAWIVTADGVLVTRPEGPEILSGITRRGVVETAARLGIPVEFRAFTVEEAKRAREAFNTSASTIILPVVSIDGMPVANGHPGEVSRQLRATFHGVVETRNLSQRVLA